MNFKGFPIKIYPFRSVGANLQFLLALTGFFLQKIPNIIILSIYKNV